jgi:hypothetical protein
MFLGGRTGEARESGLRLCPTWQGQLRGQKMLGGVLHAKQMFTWRQWPCFSNSEVTFHGVWCAALHNTISAPYGSNTAKLPELPLDLQIPSIWNIYTAHNTEWYSPFMAWKVSLCFFDYRRCALFVTFPKLGSTVFCSVSWNGINGSSFRFP